MRLLNSYRSKVFFLLAIIAVGIYTLISMAESSGSYGSVVSNDDTIIKELTNKPFTGTVTDTVANKIITYEVKNGLKNGELTISYLNGNKAITGRMVNNKNDGKWYYYYPSGKLESEGYFRDDIVVDKWTWYYPNGKKMEEGKFTNGKRNGLWKVFDEQGNFLRSVLYKDGAVVGSFDSGSVKSA